MVTILKPPRHKLRDTHTGIASEALPGNADDDKDRSAERAAKAEKGFELEPEVDAQGTSSAPGEGPNPTA